MPLVLVLKTYLFYMSFTVFVFAFGKMMIRK